MQNIVWRSIKVYKEIGEHKKAFEYFNGMYDYIDPKLSNFQSTGEKNEISVDYLTRTSSEDVDGPLVSNYDCIQIN